MLLKSIQIINIRRSFTKEEKEILEKATIGLSQAPYGILVDEALLTPEFIERINRTQTGISKRT